MIHIEPTDQTFRQKCGNWHGGKSLRLYAMGRGFTPRRTDGFAFPRKQRLEKQLTRVAFLRRADRFVQVAFSCDVTSIGLILRERPCSGCS